MNKIIAIDPGTTQSAFVIWDGVQIIDKDIISNELFLQFMKGWPVKPIPLIIEQIRCYGMAIGQTTLDTVFWSGRFWEAWQGEKHLIPRMDVKMHLCKSARAKDSNVIQALIDRFAYGVRNRGKGTKKEPGFFYGFHDDIWQAMGVAVTWWDQN
jgi:hypothetical protein